MKSAIFPWHEMDLNETAYFRSEMFNLKQIQKSAHNWNYNSCEQLKTKFSKQKNELSVTRVA